MEEVFKIAEFDANGNLKLQEQEFVTYTDAVKAMDLLPNGTYQIQKVFIKKDTQKEVPTNTISVKSFA